MADHPLPFDPGYNPNRERLLNAKEVATWLGVSDAWVRDHATRKQPRLPMVKVDRLLRFRAVDVEEFIRTWCQ